MIDTCKILIVDDRPDKLLSLEAVLDDLGPQIIRAESGHEALRQLLKHEFAVILLDVNMPGMDGFETAQFIRQRPNSAGVPIIFLTAMGDDMHVARSYSLGAVDYILTPVVPQVLRSKVAVFVDLFRKTQQVRLQADRLRQRASQLHQLTTASTAINSAPTVEKIIQVATETARQIIDAHEAVTLAAPGRYFAQGIKFASYSPKHSKWRGVISRLDDPALSAMLAGAGKPIRMTQDELETQVPAALTGIDHAAPRRGLLAAPLIGRDGREIATLMLSDKADGEFTDDDQAVLIQLTQMAAVAVENLVFAAEREDSRMKEEFLSILSHELRTPLNAMSCWVQVLRRESLNRDVAHGLDVIERNVRAQTRLIEDLLDLSRIRNGKLRLRPKKVLLRPLLENSIDALRPVIVEKQLNLSCELDGINPVVMGDPDRLQQVFWNLLSNAAKFTPAGGTITVGLESSGGSLQVTVKDTGTGIDREFLPYVFDRFRQADSAISRPYGGLGIGLTIVRAVVELHHGTVSAQSDGENRGSTFTITLPQTIAEAPAHYPEAPEAGLGSIENLRVLLVDDDADAREAVGEILRRQQAKVTIASSARQALQSPLSESDVFVIDLGMPEQDGYSLLRQLRQLPPDQGGNVPAIALTAYTSEDDRRRALDAGFQLHLPKPVDPQALINAVNRFGRIKLDVPQHMQAVAT